MKTIYPDYKNCITNAVNSVIKHFGAAPYHSTLPAMDALLNTKAYKNVVFILYDGLGVDIMAKNLDEKSFLRRNMVATMTSVFPSTTTASLTSAMSGLNPVEHGWLGWDVYIKDLDKVVTLFNNTVKDTDTPAADYNAGMAFFPYKDSFARINEAGQCRAYSVSPYHETKYDFAEPDGMYSTIYDICQREGRHYIGAYNNEPDGLMHRFGTTHEHVKARIEYLNAKTEELCRRLTDTLVVVTADHGHLDVQWRFLDDYPTLQNMLRMNTSIEPRAVNFFVKDGMQAEFAKEFTTHFGADFELLTKQQVIEQELFGDGAPNERFISCLGDFMALATSDVAIDYYRDANPHKAAHAGLTEAEVIIPLVAIDTDLVG